MSVEENGHRNGEIEEVSTREDSTAEHSFDDLTRSLATATVPRRKALRTLAAALFGGAFFAAPAIAVAAPKPGGTGCSKPGEIRVNGKCECNTAEGLITCGSNKRCVDPNTCGGGQRVNTDTCKCECINSDETLCPGTGQCMSNVCPTGAVLNTSGQSCSCQCSNPDKVIVGEGTPSAACACKTSITCAGTGEVIDPDTCRCGCPTTGLTVRCRGNCYLPCDEGFVRDDATCLCEPRIGCGPGTCQSGASCVQGNSPTACGANGDACITCDEPAAGSNQVAVCNGGQCGFECASGFKACGTGATATCIANTACCTAADCPAVTNGQATCTDGVCGFTCNSGSPCGSACCASGQTCTNGTCQTTSTCRTRGQSCNSGSQLCCTGLTCSGSGSNRTCT
jgi:hypothetical protein